MTNDTLTGTVALVTGASSGIGEATALRSPREGAAVAVARPPLGPARAAWSSGSANRAARALALER